MMKTLPFTKQEIRTAAVEKKKRKETIEKVIKGRGTCAEERRSREITPTKYRHDPFETQLRLR